MARASTRIGCAVAISAVLAAGLLCQPAARAQRLGSGRQYRALAPAAARAVPPAVVWQYDARTRASFVMQLTGDGRARITVKAGDLQVDKTVARNGTFTVALAAGEDRVSVSMNGAGLDVSRGEAGVHLELGQAGDDEFVSVKQLLAGSKAVRLHRVLAGNLEPKTLTTPAGVATLLTDAWIGLLDGDVAAIERLGAEVARHAQAALKRVRGDDGESCYTRWENEVMEAYYQLVACKAEYSIWNPVKEVCNVRYVMRCECAWFELIGCCAVPMRAS